MLLPAPGLIPAPVEELPAAAVEELPPAVVLGPAAVEVLPALAEELPVAAVEVLVPAVAVLEVFPAPPGVARTEMCRLRSSWELSRQGSS